MAGAWHAEKGVNPGPTNVPKQVILPNLSGREPRLGGRLNMEMSDCLRGPRVLNRAMTCSRNQALAHATMDVRWGVARDLVGRADSPLRRWEPPM